MQFELPRDAEMPSAPRPLLEGKANGTKPKNALTDYAFADGTPSDYTHVVYRGVLFVSDEIDPAAIKRMLQAHSLDLRLQAQRRFKDKTAPDGRKYTVRPLDLGRPQFSAWQSYGSVFVLAVGFGEQILFSVVDTGLPDLAASRTVLTEFASSIRQRQIFEIPIENGVCIPHAFVRDDGTTSRGISVNYRLKGHPDITIRVEDVGPAETSPESVNPKQSPEYKMDFFWMQDYQEPKKYKSLWFGYRRVQIDGRSGLASFMELVRKDDSIDYGYMAVVQGDPSLGRDAPDIRVNVIRDAKEARDKGLEPVSKAEFLDIAQRVTASIKQRPTKKQ
jgi:hypothetical protein